jgi:tetratricopeptide (TPR) repeat protein
MDSQFLKPVRFLQAFAKIYATIKVTNVADFTDRFRVGEIHYYFSSVLLFSDMQSFKLKAYLVRNRVFLSILALTSLWGVVQPIIYPSIARAMVPHTLRLDSARLEQQGLGLAQEASQLAQFQQYELALQRAKLATQLAPKSPEIWSLLGGLYLQANELDDGITALKKSQSLDSKNSAVLFALGSAHFQKGKYETAVDYLKQGLAIKPNVPGALFDLGNAYLMLRQYPDAIAQYEKAVAQDQKFWPAINNIGLIHYESGKVDDAIQRWRSAVDLDAKAAEPRLALAVALYAKGDREGGLSLGEAALRLDSRYADTKFLKENLWGSRLLLDTQKLLETPRIRATLTQVQRQRPRSGEPSAPR